MKSYNFTVLVHHAIIIQYHQVYVDAILLIISLKQQFAVIKNVEEFYIARSDKICVPDKRIKSF